GTETLRDKIALVHYVAPSSWAYKHKFKKIDSTAIGLSKLFDHMLVILPFEQQLFQPKTSTRKCVTFVGHPALEDFCERLDLFKKRKVDGALFDEWKKIYNSITWNASPWCTNMVSNDLKSFLIHKAKKSTNSHVNTFTICALVGSRENEVLQTIDLVKAAVDKFVHFSNVKVQVVFPTISNLAPLIHQHLENWQVPFFVNVDDNTSKKNSIYEASTVAIAVSGTVILETTLAGLPTIVIYRANRLTEILAKHLARVNYVSIPNIMSSKELIPELLFTKCTSDNIFSAIQKMEQNINARKNDEVSTKEIELCHSMSSLIEWTEGYPTPQKASEIAARVQKYGLNTAHCH
ncbi:lipid-A-disaccharide synthase, partial [Thraustotheca clavata]